MAYTNMLRNTSSLWYACTALCIVTVGCTEPSDSRFPAAPEGPPSAAEAALNQLLRDQYPTGSPRGTGEVDGSITLASGSDGAVGGDPLRRAPLQPGSTLTTGIGYSAPGSSVDAICVGFGSPNNAWCIPTSAPGVQSSGSGTAGALSVPIVIPPELCGMLSSICHDIRCYESARTSAGTFSRSNINLLAYACGGCAEPSCQSLLDSCEACGDGPPCVSGDECVAGECVGAGLLRATLTWDSGNDLDLYVVTPDGTELSYSNPAGGGGMLDRDNTTGGPGSIENVFFAAPAVGSYSAYVENYSGPAAGYRLEFVRHGAVVASDSGTIAEGALSTRINTSWP